MRLPTASAIGLATKCSFAWSPLAPPWPRDDSGAAADLGNKVHALAEAMADGDRYELTPETAPYALPIEEALQELIGDAPRESVFTEQPIAYNPETDKARLLMKGEHRGYRDLLDGELSGTADLIVVHQSYTLVADFKTGAQARRNQVGDSWQMRTLGLGALRCGRFGGYPIRIAHVHLEPGDYRIDSTDIDDWTHDETAFELRRLVREIKAGTSEPKPGHHCSDGWCKLRSICPATKAALAKIDANAAQLFPPDMLRVDSPERAKAARTAVKLAEEATKALKANLAQYLAQHGAIEIAPGVHYGIVETRKELIELNSPEAVAIVREALGDAPLEFSTSKSAIVAAAKAQQAKRGEGVKKADDVIARLRQAGAVRESVASYPKEFSRNEKDSGEAA